MKGMTAYAYARGTNRGCNIEVILRSTNSKYLEIFTHQLPITKIYLEEEIKKEVQKKIHRGRIEIYFLFKGHFAQRLFVDKELLGQYYRHIKYFSRTFNIPQEALVKNILMLPGVVRLEEKQHTVDNTAILSVVKEGITKLVAFKEKQGNVIRREIKSNALEIKRNITKIKQKLSIIPEDANENKDMAEEIALILFYINKLHKTITLGKKIPKGKALDFLVQEIQRELNAASSKTKDADICSRLLEAKNALERIKEQAQNVE